MLVKLEGMCDDCGDEGRTYKGEYSDEVCWLCLELEETEGRD